MPLPISVPPPGCIASIPARMLTAASLALIPEISLASESNAIIAADHSAQLLNEPCRRQLRVLELASAAIEPETSTTSATEAWAKPTGASPETAGAMSAC